MKKKITIEINEKLRNRLNKESKKNKTSVTAILTEFIKMYVKK